MQTHYNHEQSEYQSGSSTADGSNPGLSTAHISPLNLEPFLAPGVSSSAVDFWLDGSLITARKHKRPQPSEDHPHGKRGKAQFSHASRLRLMRTVAKIRRDRMPKFVTLTYPKNYSFDPETWKRDLDTFVKRLFRRFPSAAGVWKLEPQKRGAPHYHILLWGLPKVFMYVIRRWVSKAWYEVVGSGDEKHLKAGTHVGMVKSRRGVMSYASKYLSKLPKPELCPELWEEVGRYWGVFRRDLIPWATCTTVEISYKAVSSLMRLMRRFANLRSRSYKSLTILCDSSSWWDKLQAELNGVSTPCKLPRMY